MDQESHHNLLQLIKLYEEIEYGDINEVIDKAKSGEYKITAGLLIEENHTTGTTNVEVDLS